MAICLICLGGWATSCGGGRNLVEPASSPIGVNLPWLDDQGQSPTPCIISAYNHRIDVILAGDAFCNKSSNALVNTPNLFLYAGPNEVSWAIYAFPDVVAVAAPFRISVELGNAPTQYYLGIADYGQQTWRWTLIDTPTGYYDIPSEYQPVSPTGKLYIAIVAWDGHYPILASVTLNRSVVPMYGICFGPYLKGLNPNRKDVIPREQIVSLLEIVSPYCEWVRTHGSTHGLEHVPAIANSMGISVAAACWLGNYPTDPGANESEIQSVIELGLSGDVKFIIAGTEVLLRNDLPPDELIAIMRRIRDATGLPVTTNDTWYELMRNPEVMAECDIIVANFYPFWEPYWHDGDGGVSVDKAMQALHYNYQNLCSAAGGKDVIIGEVGWPSDGDSNGAAVPSPENAALFWFNFASWARANDVKYFYFEGFDEAWKEPYEPCGVGDHWGLWTENGELKPGMMPVFNGETMADNWSYIPDGDPIIEFNYPLPPYGVDEEALLEGTTSGVNPLDYNVVVYVYVPYNTEYPGAFGWWVKPHWSPACLTPIRWDSTWECRINTGGYDEYATKIAAYIFSDSYIPSSDYDHIDSDELPQELTDNSVAHIQVPR